MLDPTKNKHLNTNSLLLGLLEATFSFTRPSFTQQRERERETEGEREREGGKNQKINDLKQRHFAK